MKKLILIFISASFLFSLYIPLGLHFEYINIVDLTPFPFTDFYFRGLKGIAILAILNILIIYYFNRANNIFICSILLLVSFLLSFLIGQQTRITSNDCYEVWGVFPIRHVERKNLDLIKIEGNDDPNIKWDYHKYPYARNLNTKENWIRYQYGEKDSCMHIYNGFPKFLKLKNQNIR